jgi:signal transduction histidine kinase
MRNNLVTTTRMTPNTKLKHKNNNLIIWVFLGIVILIIYFIGYSYITNINQSKKTVLNKLSAVVNTASTIIDGDLHAKLSSTYIHKDAISRNEQDSNYYKLHRLLKQLHRVNQLESPIYTMVYNKDKLSFEFIGSSSIYPYYRHTYKLFPADLITFFNTGGTLDVHESENGKWLSAFAPIKNSEGKTVALLQADQSFGGFIKNARIELLQNVILALVIILPFTFLLYAYVKTTLDKEDKNQLILLEKNEHIATQSSFIQENNNKLKAAQLIIEQKNLELNAKVVERTRELTESNEELDTFLYRSSHDVQGPLTTLKGLCQLAKKDVNDPEAAAYVYMINDTTNKLYHTIKSINNVYEIKHKKINAEKLKLKPLIAEVSQALENDMNDKGISLSVEINENLTLYIDREIITLVLTELIKNCIQFNSKLNGESPYIKVMARKLKTKICIEVEDNGLGISQNAEKNLLNMFNKGNETSLGAGLGLYAAKIGVQKLNGRITLSTESDEISSYKIEVPAA